MYSTFGSPPCTATGYGGVVHGGSIFGELDLARELIAAGGGFLRGRRPWAALFCYEQVLQRFEFSSQPDLLLEVATAMIGKACTFGYLKRQEAALEMFDLVVQRFRDAWPLELRAMAPRALACKAVRLCRIGRPISALVVCRELAEQFGQADDAELQEAARVGREIAGRAFYLLGRTK